jgi:hypothetical protein
MRTGTRPRNPIPTAAPTPPTCSTPWAACRAIPTSAAPGSPRSNASRTRSRASSASPRTTRSTPPPTASPPSSSSTPGRSTRCGRSPPCARPTPWSPCSRASTGGAAPGSRPIAARASTPPWFWRKRAPPTGWTASPRGSPRTRTRPRDSCAAAASRRARIGRTGPRAPTPSRTWPAPSTISSGSRIPRPSSTPASRSSSARSSRWAPRWASPRSTGSTASTAAGARAATAWPRSSAPCAASRSATSPFSRTSIPSATQA